MKKATIFHRSSAHVLGVLLVFVLTLGVLMFTGSKAARAEDSMPEENSSEVSEPSSEGSEGDESTDSSESSEPSDSSESSESSEPSGDSEGGDSSDSSGSGESSGGESSGGGEDDETETVRIVHDDRFIQTFLYGIA